jgi:hypothetical protein
MSPMIKTCALFAALKLPVSTVFLVAPGIKCSLYSTFALRPTCITHDVQVVEEALAPHRQSTCAELSLYPPPPTLSSDAMKMPPPAASTTSCAHDAQRPPCTSSSAPHAA